MKSIIAILIALPFAAAAQPFYVVSSNTGALQKYALDGDYLGDVIGPNNMKLGGPQHMAHQNGRIFVAGYFNNLVSVVDLETGQVGPQWAVPDASRPAFLRFNPAGDELWVSFIESNRVVRMNPETGEVLGDLFQRNLIQGPHGIDVLPDGSYLVASRDDGIYRVTAPDQATRIAHIPAPGDARPLNAEVLADGDTVVVTNFTDNTAQSLVKFSLSTGEYLGAFSATTGRRGDGLIRGHDGNLYAVFYGSTLPGGGSVAKYNDNGEFLGHLVPTGGALQQANAIILIPAPPPVATGAAFLLLATRRRRS